MQKRWALAPKTTNGFNKRGKADQGIIHDFNILRHDGHRKHGERKRRLDRLDKQAR